jgi:hypothetical protein
LCFLCSRYFFWGKTFLFLYSLIYPMSTNFSLLLLSWFIPWMLMCFSSFCSCDLFHGLNFCSHVVFIYVANLFHGRQIRLLLCSCDFCVPCFSRSTNFLQSSIGICSTYPYSNFADEVMFCSILNFTCV